MKTNGENLSRVGTGCALIFGVGFSVGLTLAHFGVALPLVYLGIGGVMGYAAYRLNTASYN